MHLGLAVLLRCLYPLLNCSFSESFVQFQEQLTSFSWYRFRTVQSEELNLAKPGLQPRSEQAPPSPQHGQNRLLPVLSMGCLLPLLHSFHPEGLLTCKSGPRGGHLPVCSASLGIEAGGSQTSCPPRLHSEAISQKLRKKKTCRQILPSLLLSFLQQASHEHTNPCLRGFLLHVRFSLSKYSPLFLTLPSPLSSS